MPSLSHVFGRLRHASRHSRPISLLVGTRKPNRVPHTAAYWLMQTLGGAVPPAHPMAGCEFSTLRSRLLKVAVRVRETATRVCLAFAANCPDAALFRDLAPRMIPRPG